MTTYMLLFGISPNDIEDYNNESLKLIEELAKNKKVVAIGEIGLDSNPY